MKTLKLIIAMAVSAGAYAGDIKVPAPFDWRNSKVLDSSGRLAMTMTARPDGATTVTDNRGRLLFTTVPSSIGGYRIIDANGRQTGTIISK